MSAETQAPTAPAFEIRGTLDAEEVAALVVVLQAASGTAVAQEPVPTSEWSAHHRKVRRTYPHGPGAWRNSALP